MIAPAGGEPKKKPNRNGKPKKKSSPKSAKSQTPKIETPAPVQEPKSPLPGDNYRFGRPSKLTNSLLKKIIKAYELGATDKQVSELFDLAVETIDKWKKTPYFLQAITRAKEGPDDKVERSLYKRALGYKYVEEVATKEGAVSCRKRMHGDVEAQKFWLKNRRKNQWRDKEEAGPQPLAEVIFNTIVVNSPEELAALTGGNGHGRIQQQAGNGADTRAGNGRPVL